VNLTLSLAAEDVRRAKILAAQRGVSVSRLLSQMLKEVLDRDSGYALARERHLAALGSAPDLGTGGRSGWTRVELHER
jgi:hypothetical protein